MQTVSLCPFLSAIVNVAGLTVFTTWRGFCVAAARGLRRNAGRRCESYRAGVLGCYLEASARKKGRGTLPVMARPKKNLWGQVLQSHILKMCAV